MKTLESIRALAKTSIADIEEKVKVAAMEKGVPNPGEEPVYEKTNAARNLPLPTEQRFKVDNLVFLSVEEATRFVGMRLRKLDADWRCGSDHYTDRELHDFERTIEPILVYSRKDYESIKEVLRVAYKEKNGWAERHAEWDKKNKAWQELRSEIVAEWMEAVAEYEGAKVIIERWHEYVTMTNGNTETAYRFLKKLHTETEIWEAWMLAGVDVEGSGTWGTLPPPVTEEVKALVAASLNDNEEGTNGE